MRVEEEIEETEKGANAADRDFISGIRAIVTYIIFLILFAIVTTSTSTSTAYPYTKYLKQAVEDHEDHAFTEITTVDDVWDYLKNPFVDALFALPGESNRPGYVLQVDRLIGAVRLQQRRVKVDDGACSVPFAYQHYVDDCYPELRSSNIDSSPYGGSCLAAKLRRNSTSAPCSDSFVSTEEFNGDAVFHYDLAINLTHAEVIKVLDDLNERNWIDLQTREVMVLFTVYNPGVDLFNNVQLTMSPVYTGGVEAKSHYRPFYLMRHMLIMTHLSDDFPASNSEGVLLAVEIIFYMLAVLQWLQCLALVYKQGLVRFFGNFWNLLDICNLTLFIAVMIFRLIMIATLVNQTYNPPESVYVSFYDTAVGIATTQDIISVACVLSYVKLLRYLQLSPRLSQLTLTIKAAAPDLGGFMIIFIVVYIAYAQAFFLAFGMDVEDFKSFFDAFASLFLLILGEFDFETLRDNSPVLGPILFFSFVVFVFFILVNMFIAILSEAHASVAERAAEEPDAFISQMREGWRRRVRALRKRRYQGSETVEELARSLKEAQDLPPLAAAPLSPSSAEKAADFERAGKGALPSPRRDSAQDKLKEATAKTLLQALEYGRDDEETSSLVQKEKAGPTRGVREPALGVSSNVAQTLHERLRQLEDEQQQTAEWLSKTNKSVQEKIALLAEATFSITNMVAGVKADVNRTKGTPIWHAGGRENGGGANGGAKGGTNGWHQNGGDESTEPSEASAAEEETSSTKPRPQNQAIREKQLQAERALAAALQGIATAKGQDRLKQRHV